MPVNPDSARDSGYFIYLVTVELGKYCRFVKNNLKRFKKIFLCATGASPETEKQPKTA
jgi:hypothetical protein